MTTDSFARMAPWPMGWVIAVTGLGSALCGWALLQYTRAPRIASNGEGRS